MARLRSIQRERYWRQLLRRQAASGLSIRQFCFREKISQPSFYAWRRKLRDRAPEKPGAGRSADGDMGPSHRGSDFVPLRLVDSVGSLEVIHPRGCRIRVTGEVDTNSLQRVLDVLDARRDG